LHRFLSLHESAASGEEASIHLTNAFSSLVDAVRVRANEWLTALDEFGDWLIRAANAGQPLSPLDDPKLLAPAASA
jgi:hypothetical protein